MVLINDNINMSDLFLELPEMVYRNETIINPSGAALMLIANLARSKGIKSMLTGDAADELLGGYNTHAIFYNRIFLQNNIFSKNLLRIVGSLYPGIQNFNADTFNDYFSDFVDNRESLITSSEIYFNNTSRLNEWNKNYETYSFIESKVERETQSYLLNYLQLNMQRYLMRSDRSGMARSVELRIPYLNTEFVKLALNTPLKNKLSYKLFSRYPSLSKLSILRQKIILRDLAYYVGDIDSKVLNRAKAGIPMNITIAKFLLLNIDTSCLREFTKLSSKDFSFLINRSQDELLIWGFLQTEIFLRLFLNNEDFENIKNDFKAKLSKYK